MLPEKIMQSNLLDILFENRNKSYGAYTLRKFYYKRLNIALSATIFLSACMACIMLIHQNKTRDYVNTFIIPPDIKLADVNTKPVIPVQPHTQTVSNYRQINNSTPVITNNDIEPTMPPVTDINNSIISNVNTDGEAPPEGLNAAPAIKIGSGQSIADPMVLVIDENKPLYTAEIMPEFPGGEKALVKFILQNIHQPDDLQAGEKIRVLASLVVSKTGAIENVKIISSGRTDLDKEVLRVINKMPLWKPGMQNGKPVSVYFNLPVTFQSAE